MEYTRAIEEYNNILFGIQKNYSKGIITEKAAKEIGRFAFEYYLQWTPQDIEKKLTKDILEKLILDKLFKKWSSFPHELSSSKDLFYYAHWLYPQEVSYDARKFVVKVYDDVLAGKRRFSNYFFDDDYALDRAEICLQEAINRHGFKTVLEMYEFFASEKANSFIEDVKLDKPMKMYYKTPLQFLHSTLPEEYKSEFWLNYFVFRQQYKKTT